METTTRRSRRRLAWLPVVKRHPWSWALGVGATLAFLASWGWWATQLWGLPDIGEPFDIAAFEAFDVPDDRNAFIDYRIADGLLLGPQRVFQAKWKEESRADDPQSWAEAGPGRRAFLAAAQEALAAYRAGSEKPDAFYNHPEGLSWHTLLPVSQALHGLSRLAVLEGLRREDEGDMAGAWGWYRAVLRSSRQSGRHGFMIERLVGAALHKRAATAITRWAGDPRVDAALLRRTLDEVIAIDRLTAPRSDAIKIEYLVFIHTLDDPGTLIDDLLMGHHQPGNPHDWVRDTGLPPPSQKAIHQGRFVLQDEKERAIRVSRLLAANWLAECDKPASLHAPLATQTPPLYQAGPDTPAQAKALAPAKLAEWYESSFLTRQLHGANFRDDKYIERERVIQAKLVFALAEQIYRRDHEGQAPPNPRALVGSILTELPEGYDAPDDPTDTRR